MRMIRATTGFTLVELVVVLSVLGVLSVVTATRFFSQTATDDRIAFEEVRAALRYAHRLAVGSGCDVQIDLNPGGGLALNIRQRTGGFVGTTCPTGAFTQTVIHPGTNAANYTVTLPPRASVVGTDDPMVFDALGSISNAATNNVRVTIQVDGNPTSQLDAHPEIGVFN